MKACTATATWWACGSTLLNSRQSGTHKSKFETGLQELSLSTLARGTATIWSNVSGESGSASRPWPRKTSTACVRSGNKKGIALEPKW
eukprot:6226338-Amphidinium_carterae.2